MDAINRPSKKQRELLTYIDNFIKTNGYGPSYREVMRALDYKSVSTVAVHINGLIKKGHLVKRDHSARSLTVVSQEGSETAPQTPQKWLTEKVMDHFAKYDDKPSAKLYDELCVLTGALAVLGLDAAAAQAKERLGEIKPPKA